MASLLQRIQRKLKKIIAGEKGKPTKNPDRKMLQYLGMSKEIVQFCGDLQGKIILEVGSGGRKDCLSKYIADNFNIGHITAIDPVAKPFQSGESFEIRPEDIRNTAFSDNQFDLIISIAAFEHIPDFEVALKEMYRVLKPGGTLYTKFGPIWSGPWGHHLWTKGPSQLFTYSNTHLPPFCHLLMTEDELSKHCQEKMKFSAEDTQVITDFVFYSEDQNRLFYSDYEDIVKESQFDTLFFYGSNKFPLPESYSPGSYKDLMLKLGDRYPSKSGWTYNTVFMMLHKPHKEPPFP